jgi:hypothetical protein
MEKIISFQPKKIGTNFSFGMSANKGCRLKKKKSSDLISEGLLSNVLNGQYYVVKNKLGSVVFLNIQKYYSTFSHQRI